MTDRYPILVERFDREHPSDLAVCEKCERTLDWDPSKGDPYDQCIACHLCGGQIVFKLRRRREVQGVRRPRLASTGRRVLLSTGAHFKRNMPRA